MLLAPAADGSALDGLFRGRRFDVTFRCFRRRRAV